MTQKLGGLIRKDEKGFPEHGTEDSRKELCLQGCPTITGRVYATGDRSKVVTSLFTAATYFTLNLKTVYLSFTLFCLFFFKKNKRPFYYFI